MDKILTIWLISIAASIYAQTPTPSPSPATPTSTLAWQETASSLTIAQTAIYKYYLDNSQFGPVLTGVHCTGTTSPFDCSGNFPALTPGVHTMSLTAKYGSQAETLKSNMISFQFNVVLNPPQGLTIHTQ